MLDKITLVGEYLGEDKQGIMIGGKTFVKNLVQESQVSEDVFKSLQVATENKWFDIKSHNYDEFLAERGIVVTKPEEPKVEVKVEEVKTETPAESSEEVKVEEKPKAKRNKTNAPAREE